MSEELARKFHEAYERLAPDFGYETREDTKAFDPTTPSGQLMVAVCREVAGELGAQLAAERERVERMREAMRAIVNRGVPVQREEHRIAREALADTQEED